MTPTQSVTVFSNGVADFRRVIEVGCHEPTEISIPVKTEYVSDILDSLNVFGKVRYDKPASYRPSNSQNNSIQIDPDNGIRSLLSKLSGADIEASINGRWYAGRLIGVDDETDKTVNGVSTVPYLVFLLPEVGIKRTKLSEIETLRFLNEDVKAEIDKALQSNYQKIKPESTFVTLSLRAEEDTKAVLRYAYPNAAWTMTYSLRKTEDGYVFQGSAVVPNNTDEDWKDVSIAVVTGEPTTFGTDLAESKIPERQKIDVVKAAAHGAVEVELGYSRGMNSAVAMTQCAGLPAPAAFATKGGSKAKGVLRGAAAMYSQDSIPTRLEAAEFDAATAREVGDFSVFRSPNPLTILSKRSALIQVFSQQLKDAKTVTYYKADSQLDRPLRAIQFVNETSHSLSRGPCVVDQDDTFQGKCMIPALKSAEKCLLPHALETSLRVRYVPHAAETTTQSVRVAEGIIIQQERHRTTSNYKVSNTKDESFTLLVDYDRRLGEKSRMSVSQGEVKETLRSGIRFAVEIAPNAVTKFVVTETVITKNRLSLYSNNWSHHLEEFIEDESGMTPEIRKCGEIQKLITLKNEELQEVQTERQANDVQQRRLIELAKAGANSEQNNQWIKRLDGTEQAITLADTKTLPRLRKEINELTTKLEEAIKLIVLEKNFGAKK